MSPRRELTRRTKAVPFLVILILVESVAVLSALGPGVGKPFQTVDPVVLSLLLVLLALCDAAAVWLTFYVRVEHPA